MCFKSPFVICFKYYLVNSITFKLHRILYTHENDFRIWFNTLVLTYHIALFKVYMQEKTAISVHLSFQCSSWILPKIYFFTSWIVSRLCIQYAQLTLELYLYRALVTAVVQQAQTDCCHELFCKSFKNFHHFEGFSYTTKYIFCKTMFI